MISPILYFVFQRCFKIFHIQTCLWKVFCVLCAVFIKASVIIQKIIPDFLPALVACGFHPEEPVSGFLPQLHCTRNSASGAFEVARESESGRGHSGRRTGVNARLPEAQLWAGMIFFRNYFNFESSSVNILRQEFVSFNILPIQKSLSSFLIIALLIFLSWKYAKSTF